MAISIKLVIFLVIAGILVLEVAECRRGGGGGSRGGSRGSRGSSGSRRSGGSSSGSKVRMYRGPSFSRGSMNWKTAAAAGVVFGLASYKTRRMYRSHPNREPAICFNEKNLKNGTFGYFVCPQRNDPDDVASCCGPDDAEYCCKGLSGGAIAGIVIGIVVAIIIAVAICIFCKHRSRKRAKSGEVISQPPKTVYKPSQNDAPVTWNTPNDGTLPYDPNPAPAPAPYGYQPVAGGFVAPVQPYPPPQPYNILANQHFVTFQQIPSPAPAPYGYQPVAGGFVAPPQPYPPQPYGMQPAGPTPVGFEDSNKYPMPEGDVSGGLPYPSNPGMPYNPQGQPAVAPPPYPAN